MIKNTTYTVTPPDLRLNDLGPTITLLGMTLEEAKPYIKLYEDMFTEVELTFYVAEDGFTPLNAAWYRAVAGMSNHIIVNVDSVTLEEMFIALHTERETDAKVYWVTIDDDEQTLRQVLNSYKVYVFESMDIFEKQVMEDTSKKP